MNSEGNNISSEILDKLSIINSLKELDDVEILSPAYEKGISVWDNKDDKEIVFFFKESENFKTLSKRVHVSKRVPKIYSEIFKKREIVQTLLDKIDRNCFITMDSLWIIWNESDLQELMDYTNDEYALSIVDGLVGITWFERNICIVNAKEIVDISKEFCLLNYEMIQEVKIGLWTTIIHELRHLLLDTNIILPEEEYPLELASEDKVEEYCRSYYEEHF